MKPGRFSGYSAAVILFMWGAVIAMIAAVQERPILKLVFSKFSLIALPVAVIIGVVLMRLVRKKANGKSDQDQS